MSVKKVLVVEDEEMIRKGIVLAVDWPALGCVVCGEAVNGEEGLAMAKSLSPDIIVTDLKMPKMDGIEMIRRLREEDNNTDVIILTAYDSFEYAQSAIRLGAVDFLVKPFRDGELENAVTRVLSKRKKDAGPAVSMPEIPENRGQMSRYARLATEYIAAHYGDPDITIAAIAESMGISEGHLSHTFKKETNCTILNYLTRVRIRRAMELLKEGSYRVYEVAEMAGYRDITYFSNTFRKVTGVSPTEYQGREAE